MYIKEVEKKEAVEQTVLIVFSPSFQPNQVILSHFVRSIRKHCNWFYHRKKFNSSIMAHTYTPVVCICLGLPSKNGVNVQLNAHRHHDRDPHHHTIPEFISTVFPVFSSLSLSSSSLLLLEIHGSFLGKKFFSSKAS